MTLALLASVLCLAAAQEPPSADRLNKLEEQVRRQQEEIEALKKSRGPDVSASWTDGLRIRSADGATEVHVGGRFQEHVRFIPDRPDGPRTSPDTFYVKDARIKVDGTFFTEYGFQVEGDFPSSATGPGPTLKSAYVEWKRWAEFRLRFGQFKAPMSQERLRTGLFTDFVEDSMPTRFVPGYEIGAQASGSVGSGSLTYQLAVMNGRSHLNNAGRSRHDDNDSKEFLGRVTFSPLEGLRLGASGSITRVEAVPVVAAGAAPASPTNFDIATTELGVTLLDPTGPSPVALDGRRTRLQAELSYALGPACLRAEVLLRKEEMEGTQSVTVPTTAWSATLTWILTGEDKNAETRVVPARPFELPGGWGAVELAARVAGSRIGREIEDAGIDVVGQSRRLTSYTLGVNWWLTRNVRVSANVVREDFHDKIDFGSGRTEDSLLGVLLRFQIDF